MTNAAAHPKEFLGGEFSIVVPAVPLAARLIGTAEDGARVYRPRAEDDASLYVAGKGGIERWPMIEAHVEGEASVTGLYRPSAFMVGDSVLLSAATAIEAAMPSWNVTVDAEIGRTSFGGLEVVRGRRSEIEDVAVVQLGENDAGEVDSFARHVAEIMDELKDVPVVMWLTIHEARSYFAAANDALRATLQAYPNAFVADWNAFAPEGSTGPDGIHLTEMGELAMARLVRAAVLAADGASVPATKRALAHLDVPFSDRACRALVVGAVAPPTGPGT
jgi:hypothetical protein